MHKLKRRISVDVFHWYQPMRGYFHYHGDVADIMQLWLSQDHNLLAVWKLIPHTMAISNCLKTCSNVTIMTLNPTNRNIMMNLFIQWVSRVYPVLSLDKCLRQHCHVWTSILAVFLRQLLKQVMCIWPLQQLQMMKFTDEPHNMASSMILPVPWYCQCHDIVSSSSITMPVPQHG